MSFTEEQLLSGSCLCRHGDIYKVVKQFIANNGRYPASKGKNITQGEKSVGNMVSSIKNAKKWAQLYPAEITLFELLPGWTWDMLEPVVQVQTESIEEHKPSILSENTEELDVYVRDAIENLLEIGYEPRDIIQSIKRTYRLG